MEIKEDIFYYLMKARKESFKATHPRVRIGVVIVKNGKVISRGHNQMRRINLKEFSKWSNSLHAEVHALYKLTIEQTRKATMYIYRETKNGNLAMCKPCDYCSKAIQEYKIKQVVYTTSCYPGYKVEKL